MNLFLPSCFVKGYKLRFTDETPRDYQCNLGPDGRRRDADERPELCRGTVEFIATREYMVRDPMPAVFFFLIDVSMNAIQTGATAAACSAINQVISDLPAALGFFKGEGRFGMEWWRAFGNGWQARKTIFIETSWLTLVKSTLRDILWGYGEELKYHLVVWDTVCISIWDVMGVLSS
ncbi:hypothetical protein Acr_00g0022020 [Actinidia rufa]|uniref:Sec23/Sec24 trunk domain-containing protein n=1 Tax=Actinidia rufa TaxID=165716 RepID=A0A7J0DDS3_9ERIC|nr:hypothetical protein Acr_00g0022020 [Actinidia rufa]